jgi:hypothetical protein
MQEKGSYALRNCIEGKEEERIGEIANIRRTILGLRKKPSQIIFEVEVEVNCGSKSNIWLWLKIGSSGNTKRPTDASDSLRAEGR